MSVIVRPVREKDIPAVRALLVRTWHATYDAIYSAGEVTAITDRWHSLNALAAQATNKAIQFHVAELDGLIVATSLAKAGCDGMVELSRLYVDPDHQRSGLGATMMQAIGVAFPQSRRIRLEVEPENSRARAFYARYGFAEVAKTATCGGDAVAAKAALILEAPMPLVCARPARDSDAQDLFGLMALCFADYPGCFVDPHDDMPDLVKPGHWKARRARDGRPLGGEFWVVEDERGRVCASMALDFPEVTVAELHRLYVRPDKRGNGLAADLVARAETHAQASGATRMILWSDTRFTTAHRLYERLGYARGGTRELGDISNSIEFFFGRAL